MFLIAGDGGGRDPAALGLPLSVGVERNDVVHRFVCGRQETLQIARCLTNSMLVFHERETDVIIAHLAEADAGSNGDIGLLDQKLGEFQAAEMAEFFRDLRPGEHGGRRRQVLRSPPCRRCRP